MTEDEQASTPPKQGETDEMILNRLDADKIGTDELMKRVYSELRSIADRMMSRERAHHTLQPTALVHEAFLRLVDSTNLQEMDRLQYFAAAAKAMRRVLVDHARGRDAQKRGGAWNRITLQGLTGDDVLEGEIDLLQLNNAIESLTKLDPRQAEIVELRFFSGMTGKEISEHMGISRNTVVRELTHSRAWLQRALSNDA
ncbi:MAG: RNA polymerase sigma-70 factor (ECF subfamily) [Planctomycetota bacterium]|jgi:RNA polymerase sigma-70 factor (ECF subfamily)